MTKAHVQSILLEHDGPMLVVLRDVLDGTWLGLAHERRQDGDVFLCAPVSTGRLVNFRLGQVDLRTVFTELEAGTLAQVFVPADVATESPLSIESLKEVPDDWLPDAGFLFSAFTDEVAPAHQSLVAEAVARHRPIVHLNLNPPEAQDSAKIDAYTLADALALFQNVVQRAHGLAVKSWSPTHKRLFGSSDSYEYQVYAFAQGSFEVHMQAKAGGNLFGQTPHVDALSKLDELTAVIENTEAALEVAKANRGHFVSAVQSLLHFVSESRTPVTYTWTEPQTSRVRRNTIRPEPAEALYHALAVRQELSQQEINLVGVFRKLDLDNLKWALLALDGKEYRGSVATDAEVTLSGLITDTTYYSLSCREILDQKVGSGRQMSRLELLKPPVHLPTPPST